MVQIRGGSADPPYGYCKTIDRGEPNYKTTEGEGWIMNRLACWNCVAAALTLGLLSLSAGCGQSPPPVGTPAADSGGAGNGAAAAASALQASSGAGSVALDPALPAYKPAAESVAGSIKSIGSDTMNNLMTLWAEGFAKFHPSVQAAVEGKGSSTAPPALISGTATFGPMSRPMKPKEIGEFEEKFGYKPAELNVAIDMLGVFVHRDNKLAGLTLPQVDAIFSKTRKFGAAEDIRTWGQLGLNDPGWASQPISLYGRNAASGTYGYFKSNALGEGDFKDTVKEQPGSAAVVQGVSRDRLAIGYSGIGYQTADVRALALASEEGEAFVPATPDHAYSGDYPLARYLMIYLNAEPGSDLDPLRREFLRFVFSREGQELVVRDGYYPVRAEMAKAALAKVGIAD